MMLNTLFCDKILKNHITDNIYNGNYSQQIIKSKKSHFKFQQIIKSSNFCKVCLRK